MQIAYALEPNLSVQAFRDILIASTLAEPVERFESLTEPGKLSCHCRSGATSRR